MAVRAQEAMPAAVVKPVPEVKRVLEVKPVSAAMPGVAVWRVSVEGPRSAAMVRCRGEKPVTMGIPMIQMRAPMPAS